jgi:hypothetical protein
MRKCLATAEAFQVASTEEAPAGSSGAVQQSEEGRPGRMRAKGLGKPNSYIRIGESLDAIG